MNTTASTVLAGTLVSAGRWAEGKPLDIRVGVGAAILAVMLAALSAANEGFARQVGLLVLVAAALRYIIPIVRKAGLTR